MTQRLSASDPGFGADAAQMTQKVLRGMQLHQHGDPAGAAVLYREVLAHYPQHPDVIHYLGMAEYKLGNRTSALDLLQQSLSLNSCKAIVHVNLGRIHFNDGAFETAIDHFRRGVRCDPLHWEAAHMLGRALLAGGNPNEAAGTLAVALRLRPDSTAILLDLAHAHGSCLNHVSAVARLDELLAREPDNVDALGALAFSLRSMNRAAEALAALQKAHRLDPRELRWLCDLGSLREELGDFDEAARLFRSALEQRPNYPIAVAQLLALRHGVTDPSLVSGAEAHLAEDAIQKAVRVQLEFALGKHFDVSKDYDSAFEHYAKANRLVAAGHPYDPAAMAAQVDRLIATFDAQLLERLKPLGDPSELPVLIIGMPRSGTTLTEQILASHPRIAGAGELGYFNYIAFGLSQSLGREGDIASFAPRLDRAELHRCATGYLQQLRAVAPTAERVVDKMPMNFLQLGLIAATFPNARIIHCSRDALDTCLSCFFENFHQEQRYSTSLESVGHFFLQYQRLMTHWRKVLPRQLLEVVYEETVSDQEAQSRRLIEFCGLAWDPACLSFHRTERAVNTPSRWQVRQPIYNSSVQRWRRYEKHLGPLQRALGSATG